VNTATVEARQELILSQRLNRGWVNSGPEEKHMAAADQTTAPESPTLADFAANSGA